MIQVIQHRAKFELIKDRSVADAAEYYRIDRWLELPADTRVLTLKRIGIMWTTDENGLIIACLDGENCRLQYLMAYDTRDQQVMVAIKHPEP